MQIITTSGNRPHWQGQIWEASLRIVWVLLVLCLVVLSLVTFSNPALLIVALSYAAPLALLLLSISVLHSMMYGRKKVVLVLRKFRRTTVSKIIIGAFARSLRRRYRLVTLYDANFPRAGLSLTTDSVISLSIPGTIVLVAFLGSLIILQYPLTPLVTGEGVFGVVFLIGMQFLLPLWIVNVGILFGLLCCVAVHRWRIYRRSSTKVSTEKDLVSLAELIWTLGSWSRAATFMGPRTATIEVESLLWQQAVQTLSAAADAIIIDVSEQSESLSWEIDYCLRNHGEKTIFIGRLALLCATLQSTLANAHSINRIIGYDLSKRRARNVFSRNLRAALDAISFSRSTYPGGLPRYIFREILIPVLIYPVTLFAGFFSFAIVLGALGANPATVVESVIAILWDSPEVFFMSQEELHEYIKKQRKIDSID